MLEQKTKTAVIPHLWPGDWVIRNNDSEASAFFGGRVKDVYVMDGEVLIDLSVYALSGDRKGRVSPACGGPKSFEPCLPAIDYTRIEKPNFPIDDRVMIWKTQRDGRRLMVPAFRDKIKLLPGRTELRAKRSPLPSPILLPVSKNIREIMDASALRLAAQTLRDNAKGLPEAVRQTLIERAEKIEAEAAALERPLER